MKARIRHIGVLDHEGRAHAVAFAEGVNVVTGRSSTGKSALIEIFDYCFGSSEFTVPVGVITEHAWLFFTIMQVGDAVLVLGRHPNTDHVFFREDLQFQHLQNLEGLDREYFERQYFLPLRNFNKQLTRYFGVVTTDVDEDLVIQGRRGSKASTPSARSFTSFMLQHQNLVANKHAVFYRFDEREKREQAIDHLKIFLGFADQEYFLKQQVLNDLEHQARALARAIPRKQEMLETSQRALSAAVADYQAMSGTLLEFDMSDALANPARALERVAAKAVAIVADSSHYIERRQQIEMERSKEVAELRMLQQELAAVDSSIEFSQRYAAQTRETILPTHADLHSSTCPFCNAPSGAVEESANALTGAIHWLNSELSRSSYRLASFEEARAKLQRDIKPLRTRISSLTSELSRLDHDLAKLGKQKSLYEQAVAAKLRIEQELTRLQEVVSGRGEDDLKALRRQIDELRAEIRIRFDIDRKLVDAQTRIEQILASFGDRFEFEASYQPIRLRFSLESFDLWHETKDGKVFLRSMGSGANWLSCHLALFLALHRFFCELGGDCAIPPILFLDQPSQVYFPALLDGDEDFRPEELARRDAARPRDRAVDEDLRAVTNLIDQLVWYCEETFQATGIRPQVIVTDHADHLKLKSGVSFESLVRKRWRKEGEGFVAIRTARRPAQGKST
ncbi:DUF3732 domain-containing protein [Cupriavidus malaysiensis]|uniref:DUF3732 domain-containing protein n=1 Tax=Cupriavidus malaysiensis TaxID=367825 RepID=A0ABN4TMM8_9BURK|nr:DUF3732 domain-containing protein [Cupriavidus malaysiensis]AOZ06465.1 hypothetical protein BKK80_12020 [Cupriavidus malaysiensis]